MSTLLSLPQDIDICQYRRMSNSLVVLTPAESAACCSPLSAQPLTMEQAEQIAPLLKALADPVRLRLISLVAAQGEVCSCHLEEPLGKSQPTISHHTRVLAEAGLIEGDKRGKWTWWRVVPGRLAAVRQALGGT